jgi:subtilisin family serine protease
MKRANLIRFVALSALLVLCPVKSPAKDYVLTVGNEQLRFVPQGEKGYVVKQPNRPAGISVLAGTLFLEEGQVRPIGGLDRHGIWIVENDGPASRNDAVMAALIQDGAAEYVAPLFSSNGETVAIIPEIVVRVKPGTSAAKLQTLCESVGCRIKKPMEFTMQEYLLEVLGPDAEAVFTALEKLNAVSFVEWAAPNTASQPKVFGQNVSLDQHLLSQFDAAATGQDSGTSGVIPNDEYFPMQWHLHNTGQSGGTPGADIRAPEAWKITTGDPNIIIAVIDTGVDTKHADLIDNLVPGYDFYDNDAQPDPVTGDMSNAHGTACAGLVAAKGNNALGVTGVTWDCKIMPIKIETADGLCSDADIATAFRWMASNGADVITNSWGYGAAVPITHSAIIDVTRPDGLGRGGKGCVVIGASGNGGGNNVMYIARYPEVIAVGGSDHRDIRSGYSSYGPELDLVAPTSWHMTDEDWLSSKGRGAIWTTDISGSAGWNMYFDPNILDYTSGGGTSLSCPIAAGVAALILSVEPNLTNDEVRHFLERSAKDLGDPGKDDYYGWGRVDARAALDMVLAKRADLNNDWKVDFSDFAVFAACWKTDDLRGDIGPIPRPDGAVDVQDLALMSEYWLTEIPDPNLLAHWKLDETEGTIAHDSINKKDGTLYGGPIWKPTGGAINGALQFDGTNDYVSTPFILNPSSGQFSAMAWVKGGSPGQVVVSQQSSIFVPHGKDWLCADPTAGKLMTALTDGSPSTSPLVSEFVITNGEWHYIAVTWDGSRRRLYADGIKVAEDSGTLANLVSSDKGLYLGAGRNLAAGSFWSGLIDDVRIYNRAVRP